MALATAASDYAHLGWALVELDGKNPIGHSWQRTLPLDPVSALDIWSSREGNIGLVLGPSGVIDYEMDSGSLTDYLSLVGGAIPQTPVFKTGTGKLHILFRDPGGLSRKTRDGFELRAGPHQSVLPPSVHPDTKKPYEWVNHPSEYPLLDPPRALLDFFSTSSNGTPESHWREALRGQKLGEGEGRHASMVSFLGKAVNLFEDEDQLVAAAIAYASLTQDPPYPDEVIEEQALDIWHRYRDVPDTPLEASEFLKLKSADQITMRSVSYVWKPWLQRAAFHLLVGRKNAGKGSFICWAAAQMSVGQFDHDARAVLWIATEDSFEIDVKPRYVTQGGDEKMLLCVQQAVRLPEDMPAIRAVCQENNVGMVVIDPIVGVIGATNTNDEGPVIAAIGGLNQLADELDMCIIGVRHLGKNIERGILESVLGSSAWVNTPRAVLGIAQNEEDKKIILEVLAGNRTRARDAFEFYLGDAIVPGLAEPVSKVFPDGRSNVSIRDFLHRGSQ